MADKFSSGLGVIDFMKRSSLVEIDKTSFNNFNEFLSSRISNEI